MTVPFIFCASITAISAIISLGFSVAAALGATGTARTMALYACARSMALVIASAVPFQMGSTGWLQAITGGPTAIITPVIKPPAAPARGEKSRNWTAFWKLNNGSKKKAAYTAGTND